MCKEKLQKVRSLRHKLLAKWEKALVVKRNGDQYLVKTIPEGSLRVTHRRTMKKLTDME